MKLLGAETMLNATNPPSLTGEEVMIKGKIVNNIPSLLKERDLSVRDLMFGARLAAGTAYDLADPEKETKAIYFEVLARLCDFFEVGVGEIFEYVPEREGKG